MSVWHGIKERNERSGRWTLESSLSNGDVRQRCPTGEGKRGGRAPNGVGGPTWPG